MIDILLNFFSDYTLRVVSVGALILGITAGGLGAFAVLRQQSLLGDAISHATLPGVGLVFLLTGSKHPLSLLAGAALAGWIGTICLHLIGDFTKIKKDAAMGMVLSVFFGFGLVILTIVQKLPTATKAGLDKFLFGNAATLLKEDVLVMGVLSAIVLASLVFFWKEFKLLTFDPDFAKGIGYPVRKLDIVLTTMIVVTIVIGLQTVGVVLMSAMLVAPAAAARQWTDRLSTMVCLSATFGAVCGIAGAVTSSTVEHLPTGPTIVIYLSGVVMVSLFLAPNRGLVWDWVRARRNRRQIQTTTMLKNLLLFSEVPADPFHPHDLAALKVIGMAGIQRTMRELVKMGWVEQHPDKRWALTPKGFEEAKRQTEEYESRLP